VENVVIVDTDAENGAGSIFGEGSLAMIVVFVALVVSVASVIVNATSKKKAASAAAMEKAENAQ
jgi:hypothetical protein